MQQHVKLAREPRNAIVLLQQDLVLAAPLRAIKIFMIPQMPERSPEVSGWFAQQLIYLHLVHGVSTGACAGLGCGGPQDARRLAPGRRGVPER